MEELAPDCWPLVSLLLLFNRDLICFIQAPSTEQKRCRAPSQHACTRLGCCTAGAAELRALPLTPLVIRLTHKLFTRGRYTQATLDK